MRSLLLLLASVALGCSAASAPPAAGPAAPSPPVTALAPALAPVSQPAIPPAQQAAADALVGETPPEWQTERWMNTAPLRLADLRGKVVLVRWWTAGCPFCSDTAPALRRFDHDYAARGLVVVGLYHHKGAEPFDPRVYEDTARQYGFTFPVAVDPSWSTLKGWLHGADTGFTSVSFLLDRKGVIRRVHPGGQYVEGDADYAKMKATIEQLLAEPTPS
ncbi:MAG TPA: TlpA disulfide reductase family protein [Polyangiaceae bacterium]|jgi:peroxiredoxin